MHQGMFMLCMTKHAYLRTQESERPSLLTHDALGIMVRSQTLPWCPMHAIKKVMRTFQLPVTKMMRQMRCMSDDMA